MKEDSVVAIFSSHLTAEDAVKELHRDGFDMKKLSIVGKDFQTEENVVGFYNTGDRVKYWGKMGAFWGGLWGLLVGAAVLWIPGVGLVALAGPIVAMIVGGIESALVAGGLSALGAALYSIGIPKNSVLEFEESVRAGKFLLLVHGTTEEIRRAEKLLNENGGVEELTVHVGEVSTAAVDA